MQKTACIVAMEDRVIHTNTEFQPSKINDLFMFPGLPQVTPKAVDKGNRSSVEKPGRILVANPAVGKSTVDPQLMHLRHTSRTRVTDKLMLPCKHRVTSTEAAYPQAADPLRAVNTSSS